MDMDIDRPSPSVVVDAGGDRLSALSDDLLGHILSFLPSPAAARAATLSRRWRDVFAAVHSLSFAETSERPIPPWEDWSEVSSYGRPEEDPTYVPSQPFVNLVSAALHGRHRGPRAPTAPLRALRVAFNEFSDGDARSATAVDGWLAYAAHQCADELHVDMRFGPATTWPPATEDEPLYEVPSFLFRCAALRSLRIGPCWLHPPAAGAAITLPALDTLLLVGVPDDADAVNRLVSGCPRVADLELDACGSITKLSVPGTTRLRRLVLRNCHALSTIAAPDLSELRVFEYRGAVPPPSFPRLKYHPSSMISCNVDFNSGEEVASSDPEKLASLRDFFHLFSGTTRLMQLKSARFGIDHNVFSSSPALPVFANLRELELTGTLADDDTVAVSTVIRVLERTSNLEILSLFFMPVPSLNAGNGIVYVVVEDKLREHHLKYDRYAELDVPGDGGTEMTPPPCLRTRTREINFAHYQGLVAQRMLARFLLSNAPGVDEVCCAFPKGPLTMQTQLMEEVRGWVINKSANMLFL